MYVRKVVSNMLYARGLGLILTLEVSCVYGIRYSRSSLVFWCVRDNVVAVPFRLKRTQHLNIIIIN